MMWRLLLELTQCVHTIQFGTALGVGVDSIAQPFRLLQAIIFTTVHDALAPEEGWGKACECSLRF